VGDTGGVAVGVLDTAAVVDIDGESLINSDALAVEEGRVDSLTEGDKLMEGVSDMVALEDSDSDAETDCETVMLADAVDVGDAGAGDTDATPTTTVYFCSTNRSTIAPVVDKYFTSNVVSVTSIDSAPDAVFDVAAMYGFDKLLLSLAPPLLPMLTYTQPAREVMPGCLRYGPVDASLALTVASYVPDVP
jgi:hypothetical protein